MLLALPNSVLRSGDYDQIPTMQYHEIKGTALRARVTPLLNELAFWSLVTVAAAGRLLLTIR